MAVRAGTGTIIRLTNWRSGRKRFCKAAHAPRGYISITTAKALRSKMRGSYGGSCASAMQGQVVRPKAAKHVPAVLPWQQTPRPRHESPRDQSAAPRPDRALVSSAKRKCTSDHLV